jgi:ElaB/YqjD/DUF883 family membrane-anchored ribosome-binding protein
MSELKTTPEKIQAAGASLSGSVKETFHDARPAFDRMADLVSDSVQDLSQDGKETAREIEHRLEKEARHARVLAERYIQHAPIRSVLVAAGTGAATALAVSWLMHLRKP